ncbi:methionyl-tRNA formyltransferase [Alkalicoccus urumqiensis]|uniref:Methionyl-tRNA formyltransferase n=1 Tax=Alkalicoccus urumqiensis TaxID=1548213 RepID=A0A2P6MG61_ALKUR|nr:methionyl-tRNA formyltransferase [Alkalicoccus urumqiensis]PRO65278.1 methionyl-tRNA formyltransferase [Alkalicoccus urumqiensis]
MKIVFMGTPDFSVPVLKKLQESGHDVTLVVTQPDRPKGRKKELTPPPVKKAALEMGLPVFQPEKIKDHDIIIRNENPDVIVTAAFGQILPKDILDIPPYGAINVHASLLPKYRGGAPIHQAVIDGEKETGITIMYMAEKLDAGNIILQESVAIEPEDTTGTMHDKLSVCGAELVTKALESIQNGTAPSIEQVEEEATFARNITKEMERLDWRKDAESVYNQIRGLSPWPGAYTELEGKRIKIWSAVLTGETSNKDAGTLIHHDGRLLAVCGDHRLIELTEMQPSGRKRMHASAFAAGSPDTDGKVFTNETDES